MFDSKFNEKEAFLQHSKSIINSELGEFSKILIPLLEVQCKETESKSVIDLINKKPETRLFFQSKEDTIFHETLKQKSSLSRLLDEHVSEIMECTTADSFYNKVTTVVRIFFDPIKNTKNWKEFWKKQSRKTSLVDTSWHENMVAGAFLFVLILNLENAKVILAGSTASRETSPLMKVVKLVLCHPSQDGFKAALMENLINNIKNLHREGKETHKLYEVVSSVRQTPLFKLCPDNESILIGELTKILLPLQIEIEGLQKVIFESPALKPPKIQKKPPPLQLSALVPEKHSTSGSPERATTPTREANSMPERKSTPRKSAGRGRSPSGGSPPRGHKEISSETRHEVPSIPVPPEATTPHQILSFFPPQLPERDSAKFEPPAPQ